MNRPSLNSMVRVSLCAFALATLSLGFQNCAGKGFQVENLEEAVELDVGLQLTPGAMLFKATHHVSSEAEPSDCDGNIDSIIEVHGDGKIQLVRSNCEDLEKPIKLDMYKTSLMEHNPSIMIYEKKLFVLDPSSVELAEGESLPADLQEKVLSVCRNEILISGTRRVTDVRTYLDVDQKTQIKILMGEYRSGNLVGSFSSLGMTMERNFEDENQSLDQAVIDSPENFSLRLVKSPDGVVGEINYTKGIFGENAPSDYVDGEVYLSPGLSCFQ